MTALELRRLAEQLPEGVSLTLSKGALLEALATAAADLTVRQVADRLHRAPSTVRGWLERGRFEGAYKLEARDWRIPLAGLEAFLNGQGRRPVSVAPPPRTVAPRRQHGEAVDLGAWRKAGQG